jgi:betaine reductase
MARELERLGLPTALFSAIPAIPLAFGANRILAARAIRHPLGDPARSPASERRLRRQMVETALRVLQTPCERPTVFTATGETGP